MGIDIRFPNGTEESWASVSTGVIHQWSEPDPEATPIVAGFVTWQIEEETDGGN